MKAHVAVVLLVVCVLRCAPLAAQPTDLASVLAGERQRVETSDFRASGRLVRVAADGGRRSYKFAMKAHWFPDGLRVLCDITRPGAERLRLLLHMSASGHVTIQVAQAGAKAASVLPFERWNDALLGTDFSYEDMVEGQFFWTSQELLPAAKYGARDCFVLKSAPGSDDRSHYESVTSWIDRKIFYPVHVVKTMRGSQKDFTYFGLRQNSGMWSASQIEVKVSGKPGSSLLIIDGGSAKAKLTRKDFDFGVAIEGER